ncbi:hypothetical protein HK100_011473 [Physocladia obscura]|uniref:NFX1-type zinc finger-containing protein 1 n=1 Tax=Physocladia obscura TaxID=109957 RepID=A0AAD5T246_9FUNG|nr:hypothetical protein HK100_011473 [Physocladia obscura]
MNLQSHLPCRFFNGKPGSCNKGNQCKRSHDLPSSRSTPLKQTSQNKINAPCNFFWKTGYCKNGNECHFLHVPEPTSLLEDQETPTSDQLAAKYSDATNALLQSQAVSYRGSLMLASLPRSEAQDFHSSSSKVWHGILANYNQSRQMVHPNQAQQFCQSLLDAVEGDASGVVAVLGGTEFKSHVTSLLNHLLSSQYSIASVSRVGFGNRGVAKFSFQRALVPLLVSLTNDNIANSPMHIQVSGLFGIIVKSLEKVSTMYGDCIDQCLEQGSVGLLSVYDNSTLTCDTEDSTLSLSSILARDSSTRVPLAFVQVILPLIRFLYEFLQFFPNLAYEEYVATAVDRLGMQLSQVSSSVTSTPQDTKYVCRIAIRELERVRSIINKARHEKHLGRLLSAFDHSVSTKQTQATRGHPWILAGNARLKVAGDPVVHSNDFLHIKEISVIPTKDEILSTIQPSLPGNYQTVQQAHWLPPGPERLLDTHFRLLREDLVRPVRANIMGFISYLVDPAFQSGVKISNDRLRGTLNVRSKSSIFAEAQQIDVNVYSGVRIGGFELNHQKVCARVNFQAPFVLSKMSSKNDKVQFWKRSGRLEFGMLIVLVLQETEIPVMSGMEIVFAIVVERNMQNMTKGDCEILVQIPGQFMTNELLHMLMKTNGFKMGYLIEANQIMFEGYRSMDPSSLPFKSLISPETEPERDEDGLMVVPLPLYSTVPDFFFDLTSICSKVSSGVLLDPHNPTSRARTVQSLKEYSTLDDGQARALVSALTSELACIQGPPGTGKSYVGVQTVLALLANKAKTSPTNPLLLICFTNHALDQFLTDLIDADVKQIVRLGNSSNPSIEPLLLKELTKNATIQHNGFSIRKVRDEFTTCEEQLKEYNECIEKKYLAWSEVKAHLQVHNYDQYESFMDGKFFLAESQKSGFNIVGLSGKRVQKDDVLRFWLSGGTIDHHFDNKQVVPNGRCERELEDLLKESNVWEMSKTERYTLLNHWRDYIPRDSLLGLKSLQDKVENLRMQLEGCYRDCDAVFLRSLNIVAATTTGAAKYHSLIQAVGPKIIICEEAGEVLEAHILAAMHPDVQQLILIGDHLQLRPRIAVHELSNENSQGIKYRLDVSLFERLQEPEAKFPLQTLEVQRRMRPEISDVVRTILYPTLKDDPRVLMYPSVLGIRKNMFFVNHNHPEDNVDALAKAHSHSNRFESEYSVALLRYLIRQGYAARDIVILTPYVGQLLKLRDKLAFEMMVLISEKDITLVDQTAEDDASVGGIESATDPNVAPASRVYGTSNGKLSIIAQRVSLKEAVRVSTIDNFQGEEAKIIIISLVRNGAAKGRDSIGFLKTSNRINVLLSRAQHGMYLIGNAPLLISKSDTWKTVMTIFEQKEIVGTGLPIYCQKHPEDTHLVVEPSQFIQFAPHGGCSVPCRIKLHGCGHICPQRCHSDDPEHKSVYCHENCTRLHPNCDHPCVKRCGDICGNCLQPIENVVHPDCRHLLPSVPCHLTFDLEKLAKVCCQTLVEKTLLCGHLVTAACHIDPKYIFIPCSALLKCQHTCKSTCGKCVNFGSIDPNVVERPKTAKHAVCTVACSKPLPCRHVCKQSCSKHEDGICPNCTFPCDLLMCGHSKCNHKCGDPCSPCQEPCLWSCEHQRTCALACGAPCTRLPCDLRCNKLLSCGHQCPTVCGEVCPAVSFCQDCASGDVKDQVVDMVGMETYKEVDLDVSPVVILTCGHVFTIETLDGTLGLKKVYSKSENGDLSLSHLSSEYVDLPVCPQCRTRIVCVSRYGRILNLAVTCTTEKMWISRIGSLIKENSQILSETSAKIFADVTQAIMSPRVFKYQQLSTFLKPLKTLKNTLVQLYDMSKDAPQRRVYESSIAYLVNCGMKHDVALEFVMHSLPKPHERFRRASAALVSQCSLAMTLAITKMGEGVLKSSRVDAIQCIESAVIHLKDAIRCVQSVISEYPSTLSTEGYKDTSAYELELLLFELLMERIRITRKKLEWKQEPQSYEEQKQELFQMKLKWNAFMTSLSPSFFMQSSAHIKLLDKKMVELEKSGVLSGEEMKLVVKAMAIEFSVSGHLFQCENGHPYTIGECGGATESTTCPECNVAIGGTAYILNPNNRQFDALA